MCVDLAKKIRVWFYWARWFSWFFVFYFCDAAQLRMPPFGSTVAPVASLLGRGTATGARRMPVPPRVNAGFDFGMIKMTKTVKKCLPDRRDDARVAQYWLVGRGAQCFARGRPPINFALLFNLKRNDQIWPLYVRLRLDISSCPSWRLHARPSVRLKISKLILSRPHNKTELTFQIAYAIGGTPQPLLQFWQLTSQIGIVTDELFMHSGQLVQVTLQETDSMFLGRASLDYVRFRVALFKSN